MKLAFLLLRLGRKVLTSKSLWSANTLMAEWRWLLDITLDLGINEDVLLTLGLL